MSHARARVLRNGAQTIRYAAVAGAVMVFYLGLYSVEVLIGIHYFVAILAAQVAAIAVAFPAYRNLVFQSKGSIRSDFIKFVSVWATGALAGFVGTPILVELAGVGPIAAQVTAVIVVGVGSFLSHKYFSFRSSSQVDKDSGTIAGSNKQ